MTAAAPRGVYPDMSTFVLSIMLAAVSCTFWMFALWCDCGCCKCSSVESSDVVHQVEGRA